MCQRRINLTDGQKISRGFTFRQNIATFVTIPQHENHTSEHEASGGPLSSFSPHQFGVVRCEWLSDSSQ
jgi:hypothetical protein